jgi:hypothetical protein
MKKRLVSALAPVLLYATTAHAAPRTHDGFYLNLNAGIGYLSSSGKQHGFEETMHGITIPVGVSIGGSVVPGLVIGGNFLWHQAPSPDGTLDGNGWTASHGPLYLFGLGPFVDFYPDPAQGLHFQGMVGLGVLDPTANGYGGLENAGGLIMEIGAGYDFWVGNEWSIGPLARLAYAPFTLNDESYSTIAPSLVASFTYH